MSDNVTGYGVPLTTKQIIAQRGARTRPTIEGRLPDFELDEHLEATYRETVLLNYEELDHKAKRVLSDARSWIGFQVVGGLMLAGIAVLALTGVVATFAAIGWAALGALLIVLGFPYRKHELRKHADLVDQAEDYIRGFVDSKKARRI